MPEDDEAHLRQLLSDCVHCGFCLPACPTYSLWGEEMDSPRGRIHLVGQTLSATQSPPGIPGAITKHLDACLSCMACMTACPSGVRYDEIVEIARARIEEGGRRPLEQRLARWGIFALFPYPHRLGLARAALAAAEASGARALLRRPGLSRRVPRLLTDLESLAPPVAKPERLPGRYRPEGRPLGLVALLTGCVQSVFYPQVNAATARVLAAEGFEVVVPRRQGCCGALSSHAGRREQACRLAKRTVDVFWRTGADFIVVNAAGCGSTMKGYQRLLSGDARYAEKAAWFAGRARDLTEFLVERGGRAKRHPVPAKVAYHDACHLAHAQGIRAQPRALLREVPGVELCEIPDEYCCGSAGIYNLVQPAAATDLGERKARAVIATGADLLVSTNPGCTSQIQVALRRAGSPVRVAHLAEVLDASIGGKGRL